MTFVRPNRSLRNAALAEAFLRESGLSRIDSGGIGGNLFASVLRQQEQTEDQNELTLQSILPMSATGEYAQAWHDLLVGPAPAASIASALDSDRVVRFFTRTGTFGDLNGGNDITLPAASQIWGTQRSQSGEEESEVRYELPEAEVLPAAASWKYVSARALSYGSIYNVGKGVLTSHNFTNYSLYPALSLLVTNDEPIVNGSDEALPETLQSNIARAQWLRVRSTEEKCLLLASSVAGVDSATIVRGLSSPNSVDVFVDSPSFVIPPSLLREVSIRINSQLLNNERVFVSPIPRLGFSLEAGITFRVGTTPEEEGIVFARLQALCTERFAQLGVGVSIDLQDLYYGLLRANPPLATLGRQGVFDKVLVYRDGLGGLRSGAALPTSVVIVQAREYEKVFPEPIPNVFRFFKRAA